MFFEKGQCSFQATLVLESGSIVRRGVKTPPNFKNNPPFWVTPPFLKIPETLPQRLQAPPTPPHFQGKIFTLPKIL